MIKLRTIGVTAGLGAGLLLPAFAMDLALDPVVRFGRIGFDRNPATLLHSALDVQNAAEADGALYERLTARSAMWSGRLGLGEDDTPTAMRFGRLGFDTGAPPAFNPDERMLIAESLPEATSGRAVASLEQQSVRALPGADLPVLPAFAMEPLGNGELNALRGGYISAGGLQFDFGIKLETFVDGTLALASTLNLSDQGVTETRTGGLPGAVPIAEAAARVPNLENITGDGVVLQGNGGTTVLVQDLSLHSIRNLVVNTANDRHIVQNTAITLVIPQLQELTQAASFNDLMSNLHQALDAGLLDSVGR